MKKKIILASIIILLLISTGTLIYYLIFYRVEKEKEAALEAELIEIDKWYQERKQFYYKTYRQEWEEECAAKDLAPGSRCIPSNIAENLDKEYTASIEKLDKEYKTRKEKLYDLYK